MSSENILESRMRSLRNTLMSLYNSDVKLSTETKGLDREFFIQHFLKIILPFHIKIFKGIIMDKNGAKTEQVDLIIQNPYGFSIPPFVGDIHVCIAESVACVIEIKSNLETQWNQIIKKCEEIKKIDYLESRLHGYNVDSKIRIPFIAIGYEGFDDFIKFNEKITNTLKEKKEMTPDVYFQIDKCMFYGKQNDDNIYALDSESVYGLFQLIITILHYINKIKDNTPNIEAYLSGKWYYFK